MKSTLSSRHKEAQVTLDESSEDEKSIELHNSSGVSDSSPSSVHWLSSAVYFLCCPVLFPCSFLTVGQNTEVVTLHCGRYSGTYKDPGCFWINPVGVERIVISKAKNSVDLPNTKVIDFNGNPLIVSGVVVYSWDETRKTALDVANP
eukprot:TRINITY_DN709_c0_g2_i1.p1 TRINITY_DN709_c0_g2~~TRINITY_DN709_c0_g2_i1.p1  ORF type:complete len:147 (+),score=5.00 TRINITY_DN709_c0_g2_i1:225-665(+)